jgi:hypothetical protein
VTTKNATNDTTKPTAGSAETAAALPEDRKALLALHQAARRRRDAAPLLSEARAEAAFEIERIEIQIARIERAMDPPLV